jgi:hypothetical protein
MRRGHDHVDRLAERHGEDQPARTDTLSVGLDLVAGDHAHELEVAVEHRVDDEHRRPQQRGRLLQAEPHRARVARPPDAVERLRSAMQRVVVADRLTTRDAGDEHLRSAGEACDHVRLDAAGGSEPTGARRAERTAPATSPIGEDSAGSTTPLTRQVGGSARSIRSAPHGRLTTWSSAEIGVPLKRRSAVDAARGRETGATGSRRWK